MNTAVKRVAIHSDQLELGWNSTRNRIEHEAVMFMQSTISSVIRRFERAGGRGRCSYATSIVFDFGYGPTNVIPFVAPNTPMEFIPSGTAWVIEIFILWNLNLTELNGIPEGTVI